METIPYGCVLRPPVGTARLSRKEGSAAKGHVNNTFRKQQARKVFHYKEEFHLTKKILVIAVLLSLLVSGTAWAQAKVTLTVMWQNAGVESTDNWMRDTLTLFQEQNPMLNLR